MSSETVKLDSYWKHLVHKVQQNKKLLWAMAAFWIILAVSLCAVYLAVEGDAADSDTDSLVISQPGYGDSPTTTDPSSTTDLSTTNGTDTPVEGTTMMPPGSSNSTNNSTGTIHPPIVNYTTVFPSNGTIPPMNMSMPPRNVTVPPMNGTVSPINGTVPPKNGTMPPTNGTKPPPKGTPPSTGTPPPPPPPPGNPINPIPPIVMPPTGWLYPSLLWPPMQPASSSSYVDSYDSSMSDQSGDILIEDFHETITIHKKTIRKHQDKFKKENSDLSQSNEVDYGNY